MFEEEDGSEPEFKWEEEYVPPKRDPNELNDHEKN